VKGDYEFSSRTIILRASPKLKEKEFDVIFVGNGRLKEFDQEMKTRRWLKCTIC